MGGKGFLIMSCIWVLRCFANVSCTFCTHLHMLCFVVFMCEISSALRGGDAQENQKKKHQLLFANGFKLGRFLRAKKLLVLSIGRRSRTL